MIKYDKGCVLGSCDFRRWGCSGCPNNGEVTLVCDHCKYETDKLYKIDDEQLCEDCFMNHKDIERKLITADTPDDECYCDECDDCYDTGDVLYSDGYGEWLCKHCLLATHEMDDSDINEYLSDSEW